MMSYNRIWLISNIVRNISTTAPLYSNHYAALGVTPKATQSEIKSAYYKLSMQHHPDKTDNEASLKIFRAITEAYEVLGNVKLKKLYDKGLLGRDRISQSYQPEAEPTDPTLRFYKSRTKKHVVTTFDGKTPIYDFDAWSRNHYSASFQKSQLDKEQVLNRRNRTRHDVHSIRLEIYIYIMIVATVAFVVMVTHSESDLDFPFAAKEATQKSENRENTKKKML